MEPRRKRSRVELVLLPSETFLEVEVEVESQLDHNILSNLTFTMSQSDASASSPPARGRGRGKSRGGLGKYLRARGRGGGRGRGAVWSNRLVLEGEQEVELDEEEAAELQQKFSRRQLGTNADRYREPELELDSDGECTPIFLCLILTFVV